MVGWPSDSRHAKRCSPAQCNDKIGDLVQQVVVKQEVCRLALPHDLVPQLQVVGFEASAGFALEMIFNTILNIAVLVEIVPLQVTAMVPLASTSGPLPHAQQQIIPQMHHIHTCFTEDYHDIV